MAITKEELIKAIKITKCGNISISGINLENTKIYIETDVKGIRTESILSDGLSAGNISGSVVLGDVLGKIIAGNISWDLIVKDVLGNSEQRRVYGYSRNSKHWVDDSQRLKTFDVGVGKHNFLIVTEESKKIKIQVPKGWTAVKGINDKKAYEWVVSNGLFWDRGQTLNEAKSFLKTTIKTKKDEISNYLRRFEEKGIVDKREFYIMINYFFASGKMWWDEIGLIAKEISIKECKRLMKLYPSDVITFILNIWNDSKREPSALEVEVK